MYYHDGVANIYNDPYCCQRYVFAPLGKKFCIRIVDFLFEYDVASKIQQKTKVANIWYI